VRVRTLAAGVAIAVLAGAAAPIALSGSASAKGSGAPTTVTITKCSPATATVGKTVTIRGTDLTGATKLSIGGKNVFASITKNTAKAITVTPVPSGMSNLSAATVKVTTPAGSTTATCAFKKAKKKSGK
jgi:IPT/TIG domain